MEENAGGDELLWWAATPRPLGRVNRKVIEKRCTRVTAVYSVHSQFICRFSWCFWRKADLALCAPKHYQLPDWTFGATWPSPLFPSWLLSLSGPRTHPWKPLYSESLVLLSLLKKGAQNPDFLFQLKTTVQALILWVLIDVIIFGILRNMPNLVENTVQRLIAVCYIWKYLCWGEVCRRHVGVLSILYNYSILYFGIFNF